MGLRALPSLRRGFFVGHSWPAGVPAIGLLAVVRCSWNSVRV